MLTGRTLVFATVPAGRVVTWSTSPVGTFTLLATLLGLGFAIAVPQLGGADEPVHFLRAWQVSGGDWINERTGSVELCGGGTDRGPTVVGTFPADLLDDTREIYARGLLDASRTGLGPGGAADAWRTIDDPAPGGPACNLGISTGAVYSPIPYAGSAIGVGLARIVGLSTFAALLLARLGALIAYVLVVRRAVRRAGSAAWVVAVLGLAPVAVAQSAMITADSLTIALALLAVVLARHAADPETPLDRHLLIEIAIVAAALGLAKPPYVLLLVMFVPVVLRRRAAGGVALAAVLVPAAILFAAWSGYAQSIYVPLENPYDPTAVTNDGYAYHDVDPDAQLRFVRAHPLDFVAAMGRTVARDGVEIPRDAVAQLPWRPFASAGAVAVVLLVGAALVLVVAPDRRRRARSPGGVARSDAFVTWGVVVATTGAVFLLAYTGWNAVGAPRIDEFQGRYLFPVVGLAALASTHRSTDVGSVPSTRSATTGLAIATVSALAAFAALRIGLYWY